MQTRGSAQTPAVVVDYAHTPDAVAEALQALLMQTNSFDRWHTQPKLVQVQSASALVPSSTVAPALGQKPVAQSMVFKLEGQIEADLSNLPWVSQQP